MNFELPRDLKPVTQLYVSVDASTKDSLKKIDRPLFRDFWQRFLDSLKALAAKVRVMTSLKKKNGEVFLFFLKKTKIYNFFLRLPLLLFNIFIYRLPLKFLALCLIYVFDVFREGDAYPQS